MHKNSDSYAENDYNHKKVLRSRIDKGTLAKEKVEFIGAFSFLAHNGPDHGNPCTVGLSSSSSPPNSPISDHGGSRLLLPLRPIHLARSRCHSGNGETSEVLYTRLKRSCSLNSAASGNMEAATNATTSETTETLASAVASINEDNEEGVSGGYNHSLHHFIQDELDTTDGRRSNSQIGGTVDQQDEEGRIMVNLEAIEVVSNLDEVSLVQGNFLSFGRRSNLNPFLSVLCSIILLYY